MTEHVQKFFFEIGILFPFIYPVTFLETYTRLLKNGCLSVRRKWLALLNLIFAMVKLSLIPNKQYVATYTAESDAYYQRAVDLYGEEIFNGENIEDGELSPMSLSGTIQTHCSLQCSSSSF